MRRSLQRPAKEAARAGTHGKTLEPPNKKEAMQSNDAVGAGTVTSVPCNVPVLKKDQTNSIDLSRLDPVTSGKKKTHLKETLPK